MRNSASRHHKFQKHSSNKDILLKGTEDEYIRCDTDLVIRERLCSLGTKVN